MKRVFLVGSPRSGTTLLQSILTAQAGLFTLKETHFFRNLHRWRPLRALDRVALDPARVAAAFAFIRENNRLEGRHDVGRERTLAAACRSFTHLLDTEAALHGRHGWLEKTPEHIFFEGEIRRHIEGARFIHILRDGPDVVASLYDAAQKYPDAWGWLGNLDAMIRLYNRYVRFTRAAMGRSDSFVIRYDDLIERDQAALDGMARFLDLPAGTFDLDAARAYDPALVRPDEAWKIRRERGVIDTRGSKFKTLFDKPRQEHVLKKLVATNDIASG